jgi:putative flippase GtrA
MMARRGFDILIGVWLLFVLAAYAGLIHFDGFVADVAAFTVLLIVAGMAWKYILSRFFTGRDEQK